MGGRQLAPTGPRATKITPKRLGKRRLGAKLRLSTKRLQTADDSPLTGRRASLAELNLVGVMLGAWPPVSGRGGRSERGGASYEES